MLGLSILVTFGKLATVALNYRGLPSVQHMTRFILLAPVLTSYMVVFSSFFENITSVMDMRRRVWASGEGRRNQCR
jgi:hypothetical protein